MPDRPLRSERDIEFRGLKLPMHMMSAGVGASLFAIGEIRLPHGLAEDVAARTALIDWLGESLLAKLSAHSVHWRDVALVPLPGREIRAGRELEAGFDAGPSKVPGELRARWFVVDDRVYQLVALGETRELPASAMDSFFLAFRLRPE